MNKIEKLIEELCPNGVEFRALGEVCEKTSNIKWQNNLNKQFQYIDLTSVDRNRNIITETSAITSKTAPSRAQKKIKIGDVIFGTTRPTLSRFCIINQDYNGQICSTGFCVLRPKNKVVLTNYIFHLIGSSDFYSYTEANQKGASYPAISDNIVKKFKIPIPPLTIQKEIVKILDNFTQLEAELEVELEAEIEARKKQYEYYREELLTFGDDVEFRTLGGITHNISSGGTPLTSNSSFYGGDVPWLRTQEIDWVDIYDTKIKITEKAVKQSSAKYIPKNCVIVAMYGATAAKAGVNKIPLTTNQACCNLDIDANKAHYRYVLHWLKKEYENLKSLGVGTQSNLNAKKVKNFPIPITPLSKQKEIVAILDKFDALLNDISKGLPAEIDARKKQYEYYRNQLLTFKPLEAKDGN